MVVTGPKVEEISRCKMSSSNHQDLRDVVHLAAATAELASLAVMRTTSLETAQIRMIRNLEAEEVAELATSAMKSVTSPRTVQMLVEAAVATVNHLTRDKSRMKRLTPSGVTIRTLTPGTRTRIGVPTIKMKALVELHLAAGTMATTRMKEVTGVKVEVLLQVAAGVQKNKPSRRITAEAGASLKNKQEAGEFKLIGNK